MSMGKIIYCSDLVLRIDESEEVQNITEWLMESTEYRPVNPEGCVLRDEMTTIVSTYKTYLALCTFIYHPILMKLHEIVVHIDNYNFTKIHQNQMKNKNVL